MFIKWPTWLFASKRQHELTEELRPRHPQIYSSRVAVASLAKGRDSTPVRHLKHWLSLRFGYLDFLLRKLISLVKKGESRKANQECSYSWTQSATTLPGYTRLLLGFGGMEGGSLNNLFGNTLQVRRACGRLGIKCWLPMSVLLSGFSQNQSNSSCSN